MLAMWNKVWAVVWTLRLQTVYMSMWSENFSLASKTSGSNWLQVPCKLYWTGSSLLRKDLVLLKWIYSLLHLSYIICIFRSTHMSVGLRPSSAVESHPLAPNLRSLDFESFKESESLGVPGSPWEQSFHLVGDGIQKTKTWALIDAQKPNEKCEGALARLQHATPISMQNRNSVSEPSLSRHTTGLRYTTDGMTKQATNCSWNCVSVGTRIRNKSRMNWVSCALPLHSVARCKMKNRLEDIWRLELKVNSGFPGISQHSWRRSRWCHRCPHSKSAASVNEAITE